MRNRMPFVALPTLLLLAACATAPAPAPAPKPDVSYRAVMAKDAPRYQLASSQVAIAPTTGPHNRAPVYPPTLVALNLPAQQVQAKLVINAEGKVTRALIADEDSADASTRAFDSAVRHAVLDWTFEPLRVTTWKDLPDGGSQRVADQPKPFSQDYVFRFALLDGKPVVSTGASPL